MGTISQLGCCSNSLLIHRKFHKNSFLLKGNNSPLEASNEYPVVAHLEPGSQWLKQTNSRHEFGNQIILKYWLRHRGKKVLVKMTHFKHFKIFCSIVFPLIGNLIAGFSKRET